MARRIPRNTLLISFGFVFVYSAFDSLTDIEEAIIEGYKKDGHNFAGSGYYVLAAFNIAFAVFAFTVPLIIDLIGFKKSLLISALIFLLFMASNIVPIDFVVYPFACLCGLCTSLLWSSGFAVLSASCERQDVALNATIFYWSAQFSYCAGSLYIFLVTYFSPTTSDYVTKRDRILFTCGFTIFSSFSFILFHFVKVPTERLLSSDLKTSVSTSLQDAKNNVLSLVKNLNFSAIFLIFLFTGISQSFMTGVYSSCMIHTLDFNKNDIDAKSMVGLSGLLLGAGEIVSGCVKTLLLWRTQSPRVREMLCLLAYTVFNTSHYLIYINLKDNSPYENTHGSTLFATPNPYLAVTCSFLIGLADFVYQSELFAIIGEVSGSNEKKAAVATMFYSFLQGVGGMSGFIYAGNSGLMFQLAVLVVINFFCILIFILRDKSRSEGPFRPGHTFANEEGGVEYSPFSD